VEPSDSNNYEIYANPTSAQAAAAAPAHGALSKFHRSVSMGQGWSLSDQQNLSQLHNVKSNKDEQRLPKVVYRRRNNSITGTDGSLLMCCPSENLRKLVPDNLLSSSYVHAASPKIDFSSVFDSDNDFNTNIQKKSKSFGKNSKLNN